MNLGDLVTYTRQRYNAVGDNFFSDDEIYGLIYAAQMELAQHAKLIETTYSTTTVAGQQEYSYPARTIAIKRVTYNGRKLHPISFREDDTLTAFNQATTATGEPQFYAVWNETIVIRPIPNGAETLKIYSINEPDEVTSTSALEVPSVWHLALADFVLAAMAGKDKNHQAADKYQALWDRNVERAKRWQRIRLRGDAFYSVKDDDAFTTNYIGAY